MSFMLVWIKVVIDPFIFIFMDHGFKKAAYNLASRTTRYAIEKTRPNFVTVPLFELKAQKSVHYNRVNTGSQPAEGVLGNIVIPLSRNNGLLLIPAFREDEFTHSPAVGQ